MVILEIEERAFREQLEASFRLGRLGVQSWLEETLEELEDDEELAQFITLILEKRSDVRRLVCESLRGEKDG